ncbi:SUKH-3 domain-containing protein [Streptomyces fragilis]|uniref:SUKH-3 domain-containing protein n=1 Tax=Streptomyces fragilis TaxID=67301 RepID=A0ABV2YKK6_9ACTN|nr:SUKH-3 domain-containing protein [Streptomyces fragilis]
MTVFAPDEEVAKTLAAAGWFPGRSVDVTPWLQELEEAGLVAHPAARAFLSQFAGLSVPDRGPGVTVFRAAFSFDPKSALGAEDQFTDWSAELGVSLFPIGELEHCHPLGIDEDGDVYVVSDWIAIYGSWDKALRSLVLGYRAPEIDVSTGE